VKNMWNYRIVKKHHDFNGVRYNTYSIYEVFYNEEGKEDGMSVNPATFGTDDQGMEEFRFDPVEELIESLEMALRDAKEKPVFEPPEDW